MELAAQCGAYAEPLVLRIAIEVEHLARKEIRSALDQGLIMVIERELDLVT
jgi:hypothetical protein